MSLTALSLTALPAATGLARSAVLGGAVIGTGFLKMLSELSQPSAASENTNSLSDTAEANSQSGQSVGSAGLTAKTQSWCQKFMKWLGQKSPGSDLNVQLSLDELDQPHIQVDGEQAGALEAAVADDPTLLQEFRELALDHAAELGASAPLTLKIANRSGQIDSQWLRD